MTPSVPSTTSKPLARRLHAIVLALACAIQLPAVLAAPNEPPVHATVAANRIDPYVPRAGRARPLIVVVGENSGTVLSDFVIPYGVLARSGVADVVGVATQPGLLALGPLKVKPDRTAAEFDALHPEGADYVVVPAVTRREDPALIAWVAAQAAKGATMVSICNGSLVLAQAGVTRGHRATGHWSTHAMRQKTWPDTQWVKNLRYVADGKVISSAGITAAIPTSIALVEAIGGHERAASVAGQLGVGDWSTRHDSDAFGLGAVDYIVAFRNSVLSATETVGIPVQDGVDEVSLALTAEAYSDTLRNQVHIVAGADRPVRTRSGLLVVPDTVDGEAAAMDIMLRSWDRAPAGQVPDQVLQDIAARYGPRTARFVVLDWEYPVRRPSDSH